VALKLAEGKVLTAKALFNLVKKSRKKHHAESQTFTLEQKQTF